MEYSTVSRNARRIRRLHSQRRCHSFHLHRQHTFSAALPKSTITRCAYLQSLVSLHFEVFADVIKQSFQPKFLSHQTSTIFKCQGEAFQALLPKRTRSKRLKGLRNILMPSGAPTAMIMSMMSTASSNKALPITSTQDWTLHRLHS